MRWSAEGLDDNLLAHLKSMVGTSGPRYHKVFYRGRVSIDKRGRLSAVALCFPLSFNLRHTHTHTKCFVKLFSLTPLLSLLFKVCHQFSLLGILHPSLINITSSTAEK